MRAFAPVRDAGEELVVRSSPAPGCVSVEEGSARRRYTRIRLAGRRTRYRPALIGAVCRREALALRGLRRRPVLLVALIALRNATGDDSRRRGRAGIGEARARAHVRAALRRTLIGGRLLALGPLIAREAALHVALILGVAGHLVLEHVLPLIVADLHQLPARINAEGLIAPVLGATEPGATGPGRARGEAPNPHTCDADAVGRVGLEIARTHAELPSVPFGVDRGHGDALGIRVDPGRTQGLLDGSAAGDVRRECYDGEDDTRAPKDLQHGILSFPQRGDHNLSRTRRAMRSARMTKDTFRIPSESIGVKRLSS